MTAEANERNKGAGTRSNFVAHARELAKRKEKIKKHHMCKQLERKRSKLSNDGHIRTSLYKTTSRS